MTSPFVMMGRVLSGLVVAFVATDAVLNLAGRPDLLLAGIAPVLPLDAPLFGALLLAAAVLHALPRTALAGAALLSLGFLAAAAAQLRLDVPDPSRLLFGLYVGLLMWVGLLLRRPDLKPLLTGPTGPRIH